MCSIFYSRQVVSWKNAIKSRFIFEIISYLNIDCRMEMNQNFLSIFLAPALLTPLPLIPLAMKDITCCNKEVAKGANKAPRNAPSCCCFFFFTVPVTPSVNTTESSNKFIILIVSVLSSLQTNKVNPFLLWQLLFCLF